MGGKCALARNLGKPVPRTRVQTVVTTENAIADEWPQFKRNGSFQFDREVRNATPRIQPMSNGMLAFWRIGVLLVGLPLLALVSGLLVWQARRD